MNFEILFFSPFLELYLCKMYFPYQSFLWVGRRMWIFNCRKLSQVFAGGGVLYAIFYFKVDSYLSHFTFLHKYSTVESKSLFLDTPWNETLERTKNLTSLRKRQCLPSWKDIQTIKTEDQPQAYRRENEGAKATCSQHSPCLEESIHFKNSTRKKRMFNRAQMN